VQAFADANDEAGVGISCAVASRDDVVCLQNQLAIISIAATRMPRLVPSYATIIALDDDCAHPMLDLVFDKGSVARSLFGKWRALHS
jgi:hypothetical protein